jgi:5-enolpyruvylshikimate-3-phosphate synthase
MRYLQLLCAVLLTPVLENHGDWFVVNGLNAQPPIPENIIDVGNSGTTLRFGLMTAGESYKKRS